MQRDLPQVFNLPSRTMSERQALPAASATPEDELPTITLPTGKNALPVEDMIHEDEPPSKLSWY
jgi:hypothetical protein